VVGVPRPELTGFLARCLMRLGVRRAWVVHGAGLDELTLSGESLVAAVEDGAVRTFSVSPDDAGFDRSDGEALKGGDAARNAALALALLEGERGPRRDVVVLNAAAALVVAGRARDLKQGAAQAAAALDDGRTARLLGRVKEISQR
jgi:anthranilate phosphoribosyltransferase